MKTKEKKRKKNKQKNFVCGRMKLIFLIALLNHIFVIAKHVSNSVIIAPQKVTPISKFSFRPGGEALISGTITFQMNEPRPTLDLFRDTEWGLFI